MKKSIFIFTVMLMAMTSCAARQINIQVNDHTLTATLADNSSADALVSLLEKGPLTVSMTDFSNMEKVGSLGTSLPRNDENITTEAGDLILYQGNMLVIYYAPNTWDFTRLGKINDITAGELKSILGTGDVTVTLSLPETAGITSVQTERTNREGIYDLSGTKMKKSWESLPKGVYIVNGEKKIKV